MPVQVRRVRPEEYAEAGSITAEAYREFAVAVPDRRSDWQRYLDHIADVAGRADRTVVLVAVEEGKILGSTTLELDGRVEPEDDDPLDPSEAHIRMLGVAPAARGLGIAKLLMAECEALARAAGRRMMTLNTTHLMTTAQQMYESLGYERGQDRTLSGGFVLMSYSKSL